MKLEQLLKNIAAHDAKMETLVAEMIEAGLLDFNSLVIHPKSTFERAYRKDVMGFQVTEAKKGKSEFRVDLEVSREGLYDGLPEFLFHVPEPPTNYKPIAQRVKESEQVREEEADARKFFLPFEQEFFRKRVQIELDERLLLSGMASPMQTAIFEKFWTGTRDVEPRAKAILFYLLPQVHRIAGNDHLMKLSFEALLNEKVELIRRSANRVQMDEGTRLGLGEASLGGDLIIGNTIVDELPSLEVVIGPVELNSMADYIEGGKKQKLLAVLYDYFVPMEMEVATRVELKQAGEGFLLSDGPSTALLGYSTVI